MSRFDRIHQAIQDYFQPSYLEVIDESSNHSVPAGAESHFRVRIISAQFDGLSLVKRHQKVYSVLQTELEAGLHALAIEALTPKEAEAAHFQESPPCASKPLK